MRGICLSVVLHARERSRDNDTYVYDLDVYEQAGGLLEQWLGLRLQAVRKLDGSGPWLPVLLGPYLERNVEPVLGTGIAVAVSPIGTPAAVLLPPGQGRARAERSGVAVGRAPGRPG